MTPPVSGPIERIKQKLDIVEEIGAVVPLRKSGKAFKGLCPFHGERTASFYVFPESGTWKCFGCGEGGDLFTFVEKQQGLDFREALVFSPSARASRSMTRLQRGRRRRSPPRRWRANGYARSTRPPRSGSISQLLAGDRGAVCAARISTRAASTTNPSAHWRLGYAPDGDRLATLSAGAGLQRQRTDGGGAGARARGRVVVADSTISFATG